MRAASRYDSRSDLMHTATILVGARRVPRQRGRDGRGADDRARRRRRARLALDADRRRRGDGRARGARRRARAGAAARSRSTTLRLVVGALLLVFGLQWLRKAILRSSGYKALHDEDAAFRRERAEAAGGRRASAGRARLVLVHGRVQGRAARGPRGRVHRDHLRQRAGAARLAVVGAAAALRGRRGRRRRSARGPLARVPENTIKFAVGLLLTSFGFFWGAEGAGADWPGDELSLLGAARLRRRRSRALLVRALRRRAAALGPAEASA